MGTISWTNKQVYWDQEFLSKRTEVVERLTRDGAVNHVIPSNSVNPNGIDLLLTNTTHVVSLRCVPVLREYEPKASQNILCCDLLPNTLTSEEFYDKLDFWRQTAKLASDEGLADTVVIDPEVVMSLSRLGGGEILKEARSKFLRSSKRYIGQLESSVKNMDWREVLKVIHTIKGSSGTIGAKQVYIASRRWEEILLDGDITDYMVRLSLLRMLLEYFRYESAVWSK